MANQGVLVRGCPPVSAHPRRRLSWTGSSRMQLALCGCSFLVVGGNFWARNQKFGGLGFGWDGALVMRQPTDAIGSISCPLCSRCSHLESCNYFRVPVCGSHCSGRLGVAHGCENWIFREMTFFVVAVLGLASVFWWLCMNFTRFLRCGGLGS